MSRSRHLVVALLALALPLAACGGDDENTAAPTPTTAPAATGGAAPSTTAANPATTAATGRPTGATGATTPTTAASTAKRTDCLAVVDLYNGILLNAGLGGGKVSDAKLASLKAAVEEAKSKAPADLRNDFGVVGEAFVFSGTTGDTSKLTSAAYADSNGRLAKIVTTCV